MANLDSSIRIAPGEGSSAPLATLVIIRGGKEVALGTMEITSSTTEADLRAWAKRQTLEAAIAFEAQDAEAAARASLVTHATSLRTQIGSSRVTVTQAEVDQEKRVIAERIAAAEAEEEARRRAEEEEREG